MGAITVIKSVLSFSVLSSEGAPGHLLQDCFSWIQNQFSPCFWRWHFKQHLFKVLLWKQMKQPGGLCDSNEPSLWSSIMYWHEKLSMYSPTSSARSISTSPSTCHWKIASSTRGEYTWVLLTQKPPGFDQQEVYHNSRWKIFDTKLLPKTQQRAQKATKWCWHRSSQAQHGWQLPLILHFKLVMILQIPHGNCISQQSRNCATIASAKHDTGGFKLIQGGSWSSWCRGFML